MYVRLIHTKQGFFTKIEIANRPSKASSAVGLGYIISDWGRYCYFLDILLEKACPYQLLGELSLNLLPSFAPSPAFPIRQENGNSNK